MKSTSLETGFINRVADSALLPFENSADAGIIVEALPFDGAYDLVSTYMRQSIDSGHVDEAITLISGITTHNAPYSETIKDAARQQILAAAMIEEGDVDGALVRIADALHILSEYPKRRDTAFRSVLALLLYDLALIHAERKEFHAAERTINKAIKLFEVLAKANPDRYASAHVYALNVATSAYRSRIKQVNLLAHYQVATSTYISMVANGAPEAVGKLVDSLVSEAETLLNLGKPRDAVRYLSRALDVYKRQPSRRERLMWLDRVMLYPALYLLGLGIITGAVWANVSWGRYWAWDPKETWALVTFIIYAVAMHRSIKPLNHPTTFHAYMLFAFLAVLMTYFGVNALSSLHAYS